MLPHIFVGSSTEAAEHVAAVIQAELSRVATVQIWNQDFFPPGSYVIDTLAEKVNRFDFAILIFAADDLLESRGKRYLVARDNTVLEAGFFLAQLGRMRTFIVAPSADNLKLPSDFSGLIRITYPKELSLDLIRAELGPMCYTLRNRIQELGKRERPENQLSDGMIVVLSLLAREREASFRRMGDTLARFNGDEQSIRAGWSKATQYLMLYLLQASLIEHSFGSAIAVKLTKRGIALVESDAFKGEMIRILATDRGLRMTDFFPKP